MLVRFGFVAMSLILEKASPSQSVTVTNFLKIQDRESALRKITGTASSNIQNSLRILRHAYAEGIRVYRFSSKLIPLFGHELTLDWDFFRYLSKDFEQVGEFVRSHEMRVSFHPDHFTLLNSPKEEVLINSIADLVRHDQMLEAMGLDERAKLVMHIGGGYKDKATSIKRFKSNWPLVPEKVQNRMTLENDDKTYTALETLKLCQDLGVPMVLDIHHHRCNNNSEELRDLIEPIFETWENSGLSPKVHISSPKTPKTPAHHADFINSEDLLPFFDLARELNLDLDVMIEAKNKDQALLKLIKDLSSLKVFRVVNGGTLMYKP